MAKVLIIEDDTFLANAYRVKLTKAGFEIKIATDGQEGIDMLSTFAPDAILLDLVMPKKDGFATLAELKTNENWKHIPVIITSNLGQQEDINRGMSLGAVDFLVKSNLSMNTLVEKINHYLQKKQ